jgi:hypothetical protein
MRKTTTAATNTNIISMINPIGKGTLRHASVLLGALSQSNIDDHSGCTPRSVAKNNRSEENATIVAVNVMQGRNLPPIGERFILSFRKVISRKEKEVSVRSNEDFFGKGLQDEHTSPKANLEDIAIEMRDLIPNV